MPCSTRLRTHWPRRRTCSTTVDRSARLVIHAGTAIPAGPRPSPDRSNEQKKALAHEGLAHERGPVTTAHHRPPRKEQAMLRQMQSSVLPETGPDGHRRRRARTRAPIVERIAGWSAKHRKTAVLGWLVLVAAVFVGSQTFGTKDLPSYDPGASGRAEHVLQRVGFTTPPAETVLIQAKNPGVSYPASAEMRHAAAEVAAALRALPRSAADIRSPGHGGGGGLIPADHRSVLVTFQVPGKVSKADAAVVPALHAVAAVQARHPDLWVAEAGDASTDRAATALISRDFRKAEETSVPVSLVLLLAVFGALIAAGIPLLLAGTAVTSAIASLAIPSHWLPVGQSTSEVVLSLGMAVGIDYSLFYLRREREERAKGASHLQALRIAAATSGRAIVVSGLTVMIAMSGLFLTGYDVFSGVAIGTIVVVGVA